MYVCTYKKIDMEYSIDSGETYVYMYTIAKDIFSGTEEKK